MIYGYAKFADGFTMCVAICETEEEVNERFEEVRAKAGDVEFSVNRWEGEFGEGM